MKKQKKNCRKHFSTETKALQTSKEIQQVPSWQDLNDFIKTNYLLYDKSIFDKQFIDQFKSWEQPTIDD